MAVAIGDFVTFTIGTYKGSGVVETIGEAYVYVRLPETFPNGLPIFEAVYPEEIDK